MSTPARIVLIVLGLFVLLLAGLAVFLLTLDPERYRSEITDAIRDQSGLDVRLNGPISWSIWPSITLEVADAAADWEDAGADPLLRVERVGFSAALLPLLSGTPRLEVERVALVGVSLDLRVDADGNGNWLPPADSAGTTAGSAPDSGQDPDGEAQTGPDVEGGPRGAAELILERFEVQNLAIRYRSSGDGTDARLEGLNVTGVTTPDGAFDLTLGGRAVVVDGPTVDFDGRLRVAADAGRLDIDQLGADILLPDIAESLRLGIDGAIRNDSETGVITLENLRVSLDELSARVSGRIADTADAGTLDLEVDLPRSDLRALLDRLDALPTTTDPQAFTRLSGRLRVSGSFDDVRIAPLTLQLDDQRLTGTAFYRSGAERPTIGFEIGAGRLDLSPYLPPADAAAPPPSTGPMVNEEPLGLDGLMAADIDGEIRADAVFMPGFELGPTRIDLDNRNGRLQARFVAQGFMGGNADVTASVDGSVDVPTLAVRIDANGIAAKQLAPDLGFTGPVSLRGGLDASGVSTAALARALTGRIDLTGDTGTLDVTALRAGLLQIATLFGRGEKIAAWPDTIGYRALAGAWIVEGGLGDQRLTLDVDNLKVDARGGLDLITGDFDFRAGSLFAAIAPRSFDVPAELEGIRLPMRCRGSMTDSGNPCGFDQDATGELVTQIMRSKAGDSIRQQIEQRSGNLPAPAQQLLRGLFGAPRTQEPAPASEATPESQPATEPEASPEPEPEASP